MATLKDYEVKMIKRRIYDAFDMVENRSQVERAFQLRDGEFYPFMCGWLKGELQGVAEILESAEKRDEYFEKHVAAR